MFKRPISKFKNATPKLVKRDQHLAGLTTNRLSNTIGQLVNCNLTHVTFALDTSSGGSVCTLRYDDLEKRLTFSSAGDFCVTHAHAGPITDIQYNTFESDLLATTGYDSQIQLWKVKEQQDGSQQITLDPSKSLLLNENRADCVHWNPNVANILLSTSLNTVYLWDVEHSSGPSSHVAVSRNHSEAIQGVSWKRDGSLLCTTSKDKTMQITDPRNQNTQNNLRIETNKTANKDSKVVWLGDSDCIMSSVYTPSFQREIHLWDVRQPSAPVNEVQIDTGNNVLTPYYDHDTHVCYLIGKADTMVRYCEVLMPNSSNVADWTFTCNSTQQAEDQIKGVCMMPKFGLDLMKCELGRLVLLARNSLYPMPYYVPRRSYYDFHADVYPDTQDTSRAGIRTADWLGGKDQEGGLPKIPMTPENQKKFQQQQRPKDASQDQEVHSNSLPTTVTSSNDVNKSAANTANEVKQIDSASASLSNSSHSSASSSPQHNSNPNPNRLESKDVQAEEETATPRPSVASLISSMSKIGGSSDSTPVTNTTHTTTTSTTTTTNTDNNTTKTTVTVPPNTPATPQETTNNNSTSENLVSKLTVQLATPSTTAATSTTNNISTSANKHNNINNIDNKDVDSPATTLQDKAQTPAAETPTTTAQSSSVLFRGTAAPPASVPTTRPATGAPGSASVTRSATTAGTGFTPGSRMGKPRVKSVYYQSKYKYINGKVAPRSESITNIRNLSTMWTSECNGFAINERHAAFLISGSSGQVGVVELANNKDETPGAGYRLPDTSLNTLVNKAKVSDFAWDPYDKNLLAVACDDAAIKLWRVPEGGMQEALDVPERELRGHSERLYCIKFHPYARGVLASASYDRTIKVWNTQEEKPNSVLTLQGHTDVIFSLAWSPCGQKLATVCKDGFVRVYEPLSGSDKPVQEVKTGPGAGSKAARIEWVSNGLGVLVSGFARGNLRQIYLLNAQDLSQTWAQEDINQSPSLLVPYYDQDVHVLYLYAKGEETVYLYEIICEGEGDSLTGSFQVLSPYKAEGLHYAISFLPKLVCDVPKAEIARAYRLTKDNRVEKLSFTVPRVKLAYFQDDIYPDTVDYASGPYLEANDWFSGKPIQLSYLSMQPENMQRLTEILAIEEANKPARPKPAKDLPKFSDVKPKGDLVNTDHLNDDERKIINSMLQRASLFVKDDKDKAGADDNEKSDDDDSDWN